MDPICEFLERCDRVADLRGWRRSTLSTLLLNDGKRLDQLARGNSDIGVMRLRAAEAQLAALEREAPIVVAA